MKKLKVGKLYKLKKNPKEFWEINDNNSIVLMTIPGFLKQIPEHPIMFLGAGKLGLSKTYMFLMPNFTKTFNLNFAEDLIEV